MKRQSRVTLEICVAIAMVLVLDACGKKQALTTGADPTSEYTLVSVNGKQVPASVFHDGVALQVREGTFIIHDDGTCISRTVFVPPTGQQMRREVTATFTRDGARMTMHWKNAGTTEGTIEGNTFTMDNGGMVFVYRR